MAKDGTNRGGARPGTGPKKKALSEKITAGKAAGSMVLPEPTDIEGTDIPPVKEYLKAKQKNGIARCRVLRQKSILGNGFFALHPPRNRHCILLNELDIDQPFTA